MTIDLRCPQCGRFLGEVEEFARVPCPGCGAEITYRSRTHRRLAQAVRIALEVNGHLACTSA